jgi:hypothetical protein
MVKSLVIFFTLLSSNALGQEVFFFKEDITFRLSSEYFYVDGTYWFSNPSNREVERLIYYPFPVAGKISSVDSVDVFDITKGAQPKISDRTETGFSFVLTIAGHDTTLCHIAYRQKVTSDSAIYILRSTQAWNRPLEYAEYKLMVDDSVAATGFSYDPDKVYNVEGKKIYLWSRTDFMPDKDFVVRFRPN